MERDQVLAFRLARHNLAQRRGISLAEAAACPASDFTRGWPMLALAARAEGVTRAEFDRATDAGDLVVAPTLRAAVHAVAPGDFALYGRALIADDDAELLEQLGETLKRQLGDARIPPTEALHEVAQATSAALAGDRALTKDELHAKLRSRVRSELLPWCEGCGSHHVAPMLWRYGGVQAGMRFNARRRFVQGEAGHAPQPADAVRRFLRYYGPSTPKDFAAWGGLAPSHARRLWTQIEGELVEAGFDGQHGWVLASDVAELTSPASARGVRLLPPRDPYLVQPDRKTLAPDPELRKRVFRPIAHMGAVLQDGRLAGLCRIRGRGKQAEVEIEQVGPIDRDALEAEADRIAQVRGEQSAAVVWN